jgi:hypothetical protein
MNGVLRTNFREGTIYVPIMGAFISADFKCVHVELSVIGDEAIRERMAVLKFGAVQLCDMPVLKFIN